MGLFVLIGILANAFAAVGAVAPAYPGQSQFLIGFYDVSWAGTDARKYQALEKMGAAGFTLVAPALELDDDAYLKRAAEFGMKVIVEPNDPNGTRNQRKVWANRSEVIGWVVADDFNNGSGIPFSTLTKYHTEMKQDAPLDSSYMSGGIRNLAPYIGYTDMVGVQLYSIPYDPLYMTDIFLKQAQKDRGTKTTRLIANVQAYPAPGNRAPDAMEIRSMTYQSLLNNVDAILYYTYFDQTWDIGKNPALWAGIAPIGGEVRALNDVIMQGKLTRVTSPTLALVMGYWSYLGKYYVVAINGGYTPMTNVSIPLPTSGRVTNMFPTRQGGFAFQGNNLVGNIEAKGVHVYIVDPQTGATATPTMTRTLVPTWTPTLAATATKTATPRPTATKTATPRPTATFTPLPTTLPGANQPSITRLYLVNTLTGKDILPLTNGMTINTSVIGATRLSIRAAVSTMVNTASVVFKVNGVRTRVENSAPFSLNGDSGTVYYDWTYRLNTPYTVEAQPYSGLNGTGVAGPAYAMSFTITNGTVASIVKTSVPGSASGPIAIRLAQTHTPTPVSVAQVATPTAARAGQITTPTIAATPTRAAVIATPKPSIVLATMTRTSASTATPRPASTAIPRPASTATSRPASTATPRPVSTTTRRSVATSVPIYPTVGPTQPPIIVLTNAPAAPAVVSFTLIDVKTGNDLMTITNGTTIDISKFGSSKLTIRANTSPQTVGSVVFGLDNVMPYHVEDLVPYALNDDTGQKYYSWVYQMGQHTVSAVPYTQVGGQGQSGTPLSAQFTLINSKPIATATLAPSATMTATRLATLVPTPTLVPTQAGCVVQTPMPTPTLNPLWTLTPTPTLNPTLTSTPTLIPSPTLVNVCTATPTASPTFTQTPTYTPTFTQTPTLVPTFTETPTLVPTFTETPTATPTP